MINKPKVIIESGIPCYESKELGKYIIAIGRQKDFDEWFGGQTGMVTKRGEYLIYKHDVDRFLAGGSAMPI